MIERNPEFKWWWDAIDRAADAHTPLHIRTIGFERDIMRLKGLSEVEQGNLLTVPGQMVFLGYRGSITHGTYVPSSSPDSIDDKDLIGVFLDEPSAYLGFGGRKTTYERKYKEWDVVLYEYRHFVNMLCKQNPNVLSTLWLQDKHILQTSRTFENLVENRAMFVSKQAYHSFTGYAYGQLKRMTHLACKGYMGEKRKRLVEKYGYDTKNAAHLIRLLRMGIEFLNEGVLHVERRDATNLLDIKNGGYSLIEIQQNAQDLFDLARKAYLNSELPNEVDKKAVEKMVMTTVWNHLCLSYGDW